MSDRPQAASTGLALSEASAIESIARLPPELAVLKMEHDSIMAVATRVRPSHKAVLADLREQIEAYPSFAEQVIYNKPVGKDPRTGQQRFARGLSIRAAEGIAASLGGNKVRTYTRRDTPDTAIVGAIYVDFTAGRLWEQETVVSKIATRRDGGTYRINDDRFYNLVCKAEQAKCVREVILRCMPAGLKSELMLMAEHQIDELLTEETVAKIIGQFSGKGVSQIHLEKLLGKPLADFTKKDRLALASLWTGLETEETTVGELLAALDEGQPGLPTGESPTQEVAAKAADRATKRRAKKKEAKPDATADDPSRGKQGETQAAPSAEASQTTAPAQAKQAGAGSELPGRLIADGDPSVADDFDKRATLGDNKAAEQPAPGPETGAPAPQTAPKSFWDPKSRRWL